MVRNTCLVMYETVSLVLPNAVFVTSNNVPDEVFDDMHASNLAERDDVIHARYGQHDGWYVVSDNGNGKVLAEQLLTHLNSGMPISFCVTTMEPGHPVTINVLDQDSLRYAYTKIAFIDVLQRIPTSS